MSTKGATPALHAIRHRLGLALMIMLLASAFDAPAFQKGTAPKVETLGPFALGPAPAQRVTVIANYAPAASAAFAGESTLSSWTIQGSTGGTLFREVFDAQKPEVADVNVIELAAVLVGQGRRFLLVQMGQEPSAPPGGSSYVAFGFDRGGTLRQLARLVSDGPGLMKTPGPTGEIPLNDGRYLDVAEWTSWFYMTYRYEYDEPREQFVTRNRCAPPRDATFSPEALRERIAERDNVVTLRRSMDLTSPGRRIPITPETKIQPLLACAVDASRSPNEQTKTYFLQIRIDGKNGWVSEDDFRRLGMQQAG